MLEIGEITLLVLEFYLVIGIGPSSFKCALLVSYVSK